MEKDFLKLNCWLNLVCRLIKNLYILGKFRDLNDKKNNIKWISVYILFMIKVFI